MRSLEARLDGVPIFSRQVSTNWLAPDDHPFSLEPGKILVVYQGSVVPGRHSVTIGAVLDRGRHTEATSAFTSRTLDIVPGDRLLLQATGPARGSDGASPTLVDCVAALPR